MDPIAISSSFGTVVSLAVEFISQRKANQDIQLKDFKDWLVDHKHDEILRLLNSNIATSVSIKAIFNDSQSKIMDKLNLIQQQLITGSPYSENELVSVSADVVEEVTLAENNSYVGTAADMADLATRCAINTIQGKKVEFNIVLQATVLNKTPLDPLILPKYEKARLDRALILKARLELLASKEIYQSWQYYLSTKESWLLAIQSLILRADFKFNGDVTGLCKIDVWRTAEPKLSAPIFLSEEEVSNMLNWLGFTSTRDLSFGANWRASTDLPHEIIAQHVIPSIIVQIDLHDLPPTAEALSLISWHIGEG